MSSARRDFFALLILAAIVIGQGFYAVRLNTDFYKEHTPFFDSCSYAKQLAIVASKTRRLGYGAGISESLSGNVALPFLEATAVSKVLMPSRAMAVWLQAIWMIALALSVYWYFAHYRKLDRWLAVLLALPFVSFLRVYDWNGGLPDFRMDLSLYIFASLTAVWYMATYETEARLPWVMAGLAAMFACLARATSPVYLVLMLGPLFLVRLVGARGKRKALLVNCAWMCLPVMIAAGVFLAHNFSYLFFYYVTWGADENRNLPWRESAIHFKMAVSHAGDALIWCALAAIAINVICIRRFPRLDWKPLWLMMAAPLFLVVRGVGLNPFVTMPAVFGFLLFAAVPFEGEQPASRFLWARGAIGLLMASGAILCAAAAGRPQMYSGPSVTSMPGVRAMIDRASQDARSRGLDRIEFIAPELGDCHSCMISNVLIYEYGAIPSEGKEMVVPGGLTYHFPNELTFTASDELFWKMNVAGKSDAEKIQSVVAMMASESPAYLLLPDEATLAWLERDRGVYFINLRTRAIMAGLMALNKWVSLGEPVRVDANEKMEVFAPREVQGQAVRASR